MYIRFGSIPSRARDAREIMKASLENSNRDWKVCRVRTVQSVVSARRQASHMGVQSSAIAEQDYEVSLH